MAEIHFESMKDMNQRLRNSGAGSQVKAVMTAIDQITKSPGALDNSNASSAIYHLAVALVGADHAIGLLDNTLSIACMDFEEE